MTGVGPTRPPLDELTPILDEAVSLITSASDVTGVLLVVFTADLEAPSGRAVSLQMRGELPGPKSLGKVVEELLTRVSQRGDPS